MMKLKSTQWLALATIAAGIWACAPSANNPKPISESQEVKEVKTEAAKKDLVSYETAIKPIMEENCTKCHQQGKKTPYLDSYAAVVKNAKKGELYESVKDGYMPKKADKLAQQKIDLIQQWIADAYQP